MQNTLNAIFGDQFYQRCILKMSKNLNQLQDRFYTWNTHLGTCMVELNKPSCQAETGKQKLFFHLNKRLNVALNKENCTFCLFGHTRYIIRVCYLIMRKQNLFLLLYMYATAKSEIHVCSNRKHETGLVLDTIKVRKRAEIRNHYNQAPHLTQDTNDKVTTSQLDITNKFE